LWNVAWLWLWNVLCYVHAKGGKMLSKFTFEWAVSLFFFKFSVPVGYTRNRTEFPETETKFPEPEIGTDRFQFLGNRIIRGTEYPNRSVSGTRMPRVTRSLALFSPHLERPTSSSQYQERSARAGGGCLPTCVRSRHGCLTENSSF
jgi:hypothetical protein